MMGSVIIRVCVSVAASLMLCGCSIPRYAIGLDDVLENEIGKSRDGVSRYMCTKGAHRGDSVLHRENTMAAFRAANTNKNFAFIEFDVQYSSDDKIVVFHDTSLKRLFKTGDKVGSRTFAELVELSGGEISSYDEVMAVVEDTKLNIEIKSQGDDDEDERLADYLVADIEARGIEDEVVISSISGDVIKYINQRYADILTGQIFYVKSSTYVHLDMFTRKLYKDIGKTEADYLMLYVANLRNIEDLLEFKPSGKTVMFWDFDDMMYLVHKDMSDRLWGDSWCTTLCKKLRYKMRWVR